MTKAKEFSKQMQDALERQRTVQDDLIEITGERPTHQFRGILFSVTNDGNIGMHRCESGGTQQPAIYEVEVGLKFAQWIQENFQ